MVPSPKSPQHRAFQQQNSEALAEYYRLAAKGHFAPAMTASHPAPNEHPHTPVGQFSGLLGPSSPSAFSQERAPAAFLAASSPPYVYKPRNLPPPTYTPPYGIRAPVIDACAQYAPERQPPPGVAQSVSKGYQPTPVTTPTPHATGPQAPPPTLPSIARSFNGSHMPTMSPYATASSSAYAAPAFAQTPPHTHANHVQQPGFGVIASHNSNVSHVQQPNYKTSITHVPWLQSTTPLLAPVQQPQFNLQDPPQPPAAPSITYNGLCTRIHDLLQDTLPPLPRWEPADVMTLASSLASQVVSAGECGSLGPEGLWSYQDIFVAVGHEGNMPHDTRYLALVATAPGQLRILLKTGSYNFGGSEPARDERLLAHMRQGFHNIALDHLGRLKGRGKRGS